jgi:hypothetical protein
MASVAAQVVFNEAEHTYTVDGVRWPSVTQILDPLLELDGIPRAALEAAARFGNHVHQACHLYDLNRLDEEDLDEPLRPYLEGWKAFLRDTGAFVCNSEQRILHPKLRYAGTLDKTILWKERRHVLDIKSGAEVPPTVGPQTAAYREALLESQSVLDCSRTRYCLHLRPDETYRLHTLNDPADFHLFVSALNIHRWREKHGRRG